MNPVRLSRWVLLAGLASVLSTTPLAQTWQRVFDAHSNVDASLAVGAGGISVVHKGAGAATQIGFDPQGSMTSFYRHATVIGEERWNDVIAADEDRLIVAGQAYGHPWMGEIDESTGHSIWSRAGAVIDGEILAACLTSTGIVVGVGYRDDNTELPFLWASDRTGLTLWRKVLTSAGVDERAVDIVELASGDFIIASTSSNGLRLTRMSPDGDVLHRRRYDSGYSLGQPHLTATNDGGYLLAGLASGRFFTLKFGAASFTSWSYRYVSPDGEVFVGSTQEVGGVVEMPDGGYALAVTQPDESEFEDDPGILRLDSDGEVEWLRTYGNDVDQVTHDIALTPDGGFVLTAGDIYGGKLRVLRVRADGETSCDFEEVPASTTSGITLSVVQEATTSFDESAFWGEALVAPLNGSIEVEQPCHFPCSGIGGSYGAGLAGAGGIVPTLEATDGACLGWTPEFRVTGGLGGTFGLLAFGFGPAAIPLLEGTLLVDPNQLFTVPLALDGPLAVPGAGTQTLAIPAALDLTPLLGTTFYVQAFLLDALAPDDVSMSNGATLTIQ